MPITSVTTLDGHIINVADLSEREQLYCLALASTDATHYNGNNSFDCIIGQAGTALSDREDEPEIPVDVVIEQFPDLSEEILTIYADVAEPPYAKNYGASFALAARVLDIPKDRAEYLRNHVVTSHE